MSRRKWGDPVNGLILLDKPLGASSNRALQTARKLLNANKAGHTGSLDPLATGLLPLCFGQSTRLCSFFLDEDKSYQVSIRLGIETESGDSEGAITREQSVDLSDHMILQALDTFRGVIEQVPPMYSALKKDGQPLYKLARKGIEIERKPRTVTVHDLQLLSREGSLLTLNVSCSKGFYVRSLAMDLGSQLGCGGHVEILRRTTVGKFSIDQAVTLEQLEALKTPSERRNLLIPPDSALQHLPKIDLPATLAKFICQGQAVRSLPHPPCEMARIYAEGDRFLGLGEVTADGKIHPRKMFI